MSYHHPQMWEKNHNSSTHFFIIIMPPLILEYSLKSCIFYSDIFISQRTTSNICCVKDSYVQHIFFKKLSSLNLRMYAYIFYINLFIFRRICENMRNSSTNIFRIISSFNLKTSLFLNVSTPNMTCGKIHNSCKHFCLFIS